VGVDVDGKACDLEECRAPCGNYTRTGSLSRWKEIADPTPDSRSTAHPCMPRKAADAARDAQSHTRLRFLILRSMLPSSLYLRR
jgi:hypothetical protein